VESLIQNNSEHDPERHSREKHHHRMRLLPEQAEQSTPCPLEQLFDGGVTNASIIAARLRNFTQDISEENF
jgi:hypothetical protein